MKAYRSLFTGELFIPSQFFRLICLHFPLVVQPICLPYRGWA